MGARATGSQCWDASGLRPRLSLATTQTQASGPDLLCLLLSEFYGDGRWGRDGQGGSIYTTQSQEDSKAGVRPQTLGLPQRSHVD